MASIEARLQALVDIVQRRQAAQEVPADPLSESLISFYDRLAGMDSLEKAALLAALNEDDPLDGSEGLALSLADLEKMITDSKTTKLF